MCGYEVSKPNQRIPKRLSHQRLVKRLWRYRSSVVCAAFALGFTSCLRCIRVFFRVLRGRSNSTVLCFGLLLFFGFWLATARFSSVCLWCCRAFIAVLVRTFVVSLRPCAVLLARSKVVASFRCCFGVCFRLALLWRSFCAAQLWHWLCGWRCSLTIFQAARIGYDISVTASAAILTHQQQPNKALHPTVYSQFVFGSCKFSWL